MDSTSSTPSPAPEANENLPWLLIYGFIVVLVLFFLYSAARYIVFLILEPPTPPAGEFESDTDSNSSNNETETTRLPTSDETVAKESVFNRPSLDSIVSRSEALMLSMLSRFFRKKDVKGNGVWHTGVHPV